LITPERSSRWKAVSSEPGLTLKTPREICSIRRATPKPCRGARLRVFRMSRSRVPGITSVLGSSIVASLESNETVSPLILIVKMWQSTHAAEVRAAGDRSAVCSAHGLPGGSYESPVQPMDPGGGARPGAGPGRVDHSDSDQ